MASHIICEICGEACATKQIRSSVVEYNGETRNLQRWVTVCTACDSEFADESDLRSNKRAMNALKKAIDGMPLGSEIRSLRETHHLTQKLASEIFGGGPVAFSKYENDDVIPNEAMCLVLQMAIAYPDTVQRAATIKGIVLEITTIPNKETQAVEMIGPEVIVELKGNKVTDSTPDFEKQYGSETDPQATDIKKTYVSEKLQWIH